MKKITFAVLSLLLSLSVFAIEPPSGNSLLFNGTNNYVNLGNSSVFANLSTHDFTIEMFVKTTNAGRSILIGNYNGNPSYNFEINDDNGGGVLRMYLNGISFIDDQSIADGKWHHIAMVVDFTNDFVKMYIDGVESYSASNTVTPFYVNNDLMLSRDPMTDSLYFGGNIDEVRIWDYARSADSISNHIYTSYTGREQGLIAYYTFEDASCSNSLTDLTLNATGELVNSPLWINNQGDVSAPVNINTSDITINTFKVNWEVSYYGTPTSYSVQIDDNNDFSSPLVDTSDITDLFYKATDVTNGITYYYRVKAVNGGDGIYSCTDSVTIIMSTPGILEATNITDTSFTANWGKVICDKYLLDVSTQPDFSNYIMKSVDVGNVLHYCVTGLSPGEDYYYRVVAVGNSNTTDYSDTMTVETTIIPKTTSLYFDGVNDYVDCGGDIDLSNKSFSISFWAKRKTIDTDDFIIGQGEGATDRGLHIGFRGNNRFTFAFHADDLDSPVYTDNEWHHWACVYDNAVGTKKIYRDSILVAIQTNSKAFQYSGDVSLQIGSIPFWDDYAKLKGFVDEVGIWDTVLNPQDIKSIMKTTPDGSEAGLIAFYNFEESVCSDTITDLSGNNNTGSLINNPSWINSAVELSTPVGIDIVNITKNSFNVIWDKPIIGTATSYRVQVDDTVDFSSPIVDVAGVTEMSYNITGLSYKNTYYYRISAINNSGAIFSCPDSINITTTTPNTAHATNVTDTSFTANWELVATDKYLLDVSTHPDFSSPILEDFNVGNVANYQVYGLVNNTDYFYRVRAVTGVDTTDYSDTMVVETIILQKTSSLSLNESYSYVNCSNGIDLSNKSFSISFWAKRKSINADNYIIGLGTKIIDEGLHIGFRSNNKFTFAFYDDDLNTTQEYTDNNWHHWACVYDNITGTKKIYQDSILIATQTGSNYFKYTGWGTLQIGKIPFWLFDTYFKGYIDEVGIWSKVLTPQDIKNIMRTTPDGSEDELMAFYNFEESECDNTVFDISENGNTGYLKNNAIRINSESEISAPEYTEISDVSDSSFKFNWLTPLQGQVTSYKIQIDDTPDFSSPVIDTTGVTDLFYNAKGLPYGKTYYCRVNAVNDKGQGILSCPNEVSIIMITPNSLDATEVTDTSFVANWEKVIANKYLLDVSTKVDFSECILKGFDVGYVQNYKVTGLSSGTNYFYRVVAVREADTTNYSDIVFVKTDIIPNGNALKLDGNSHYVQFPTINTETDITYEIMYYADTISNWQRIFDFSNAPDENIFLTVDPYDNPQYPRFVINTDSVEQQINSSQKIEVGKWYHIAITLKADIGKMYINGRLVGENTSFTNNPVDLGTTQYNYIGKSQYDDPMLNGKIDEFRIWNYARTEDSINININTAYSGSETGLIAYYNFEEPACSDSIIDLTNNSNTGYLINNPVWFNPKGKLSAPSNLNTSYGSKTSFMLKWDIPVYGTATSYRVQINTTADFSSPIIDTAGVTTLYYNADKLLYGETYYYRVKSVNNDGAIFSCVDSIKIITMTPNAFEATDITDTQFTANWKKVIADKYLIDISTQPDFSSYLIKNLDVGNVTSYKITGLSPATDYFYRVIAISDADTTDYSDTISVSTIALPNGKALFFDGVDDYVICNNVIDLSNKSFSISFWAKRDGLNTDDFVIGLGDPALDKGLHIGFRNSNKFTFAFFADDLDTPVYTDNEWHHWTCVYDNEAKTKKIYRDSSLVATQDNSKPYQYTGSKKITIGNVNFWGSNPKIKGLIDEVGIWDTVLTPQDIKNIMEYSPTGNEAKLIAFYNFEESACSKTLTDISQNNHDGSLINNPVWTYFNSDVTTVSNFRITYTTSHTLRIDWNAQSFDGDASYTVQVDDNSDFSSPLVNAEGISDLHYIATGLSIGAKYFCRVKADNTIGDEFYSCIDSAILPKTAQIGLSTYSIADTVFSCGNYSIQKFTIYNTGDTNLVYSIENTQGYLTTSVTNDTIAINDSVIVEVIFNSDNLQVGTYYSNISVKSNDPAAPDNTINCAFTVKGDPEITVNINSISFSDIKTGGSLTDSIYIINSGCDILKVLNIYSNNSAFTTDVAAINVNPFDTSLIYITFSSPVESDYSDTITIVNNAGADIKVLVSGKCTDTNTKVVAISGDINLGNVVINTTASTSFTISNRGNSELTVSKITTPDMDITVDKTSVVIPANNSVDINVAITPTMITTFSGDIIVFSDGTNQMSSTINFSAIGVPNESTLDIAMSDSVFGIVPFEQTSNRILTISNRGYIDLNISGYEFSSSDFTADWTGTIHAGESQDVTITFKPSVIGDFADTIKVISDASNVIDSSIVVTATGQGGQIALSGNMNFENIETETTKTATLTVTNTGNLDFIVTELIMPDAVFSCDLTSTTTIAPSESISVTISFSPEDVKEYSGDIIVNGDFVTGVNTIEVYGSGDGSIIGLSGNANFGDVPTGDTATAVLTIANSGTIDLIVSGIACSDHSFTIDWLSGVVAPGTTKDIVVSFTPQTVHEYSGIISIVSNTFSKSKNNTITTIVTGNGVVPLVAGFTATPLFGEAPLVVQFSDTSSGDVDSYLWDFGDGATSTLQSPEHTYTVAGNYTVSLEISNSIDNDKEVKTDYIMATINDVTFNISDGKGTIAGAVINFNGDEYVSNANGVVTIANVKSGNYRYTITADGFEEQTGSIEVDHQDVKMDIVMITVGIEDCLSNKITLYPNPTDGVINILHKNINIKKIVITKLDGKVVLVKRSMQLNNKIDISSFDNGIYLIKIQTDTEIVIKKMIKQ